MPDKQQIPPNKSDTSECWYCGCKHELRKRELCQAFGKLCNKCHKPNHFANKCRNISVRSSVRMIDENIDEVFPTQIAAVGLDDSVCYVEVKIRKFFAFPGRHGYTVQCYTTGALQTSYQGPQTHADYTWKVTDYSIRGCHIASSKSSAHGSGAMVEVVRVLAKQL